mmetsp:Transcript_12321/g.18581  ORF Transcript_12321/g.18581 Transcript_12321/m.18581 type:complete len:212 (-) Transcript_12321:401-1036(-)
MHECGIIRLFGKFTVVRIVSKETSFLRNMRIGNHERLEMKSSVCHKYDALNVRVVAICLPQVGRGAAQHFCRRQRFCLRDENVVVSISVLVAQRLFDAGQHVRKLDSARNHNALVLVVPQWIKVVFHAGDKMLGVDGNLDKHVQHALIVFVAELRDGYQTRVSIVHQKVALQRFTSVVVDAACAVGHVGHDTTLDLGKLLQNVRDDAGIHE